MLDWRVNDPDTQGVTELERTKFRFSWHHLPSFTTTPGTGGVIRHVPEDFLVTEKPLYLPEGRGPHAYALVEKRTLTTRDLVQALMELGVPEQQIGVAGLKDKHAVTAQWLSVPGRYETVWQTLDNLPNIRVLQTSRHRNKLGIGHLAGNCFQVRVRQAPEQHAQAHTTLTALAHHGVPNYFGPQRFGRFGNNAIDGLKLIRGQSVPGSRSLKRFFLSALQSYLFNYELKLRLERDLFTGVLLGDWVKKHDTGGVFCVEDVSAELPRALRLEISATQPLYGKKVKVSPAEAGVLEEEVLAYCGLRWPDFTSRKGSRRLTRIMIAEPEVTAAEDGYWVTFTLPKGAFATCVLREILKQPIDEPDISPHDRSEQTSI